MGLVHHLAPKIPLQYIAVPLRHQQQPPAGVVFLLKEQRPVPQNTPQRTRERRVSGSVIFFVRKRSA